MSKDSSSARNPDNTKSGPTLARMAGSFTKSMAQFAASGFQTVPKEVHELRVVACEACEHRSGAQCQLCGCVIEAKGWLPHEDCPLGKWAA